MKTRLLKVLILAILLVPGVASAQILINENFENFTAGQQPGSPWSVGLITSPSSILVSTDAQSPFGAGGDTQGLVWYDGDTTSWGPNLSTSFAMPSGTTSLIWSFDFMAPADGIASNPIFYLADGSGKIGPRLFLDRTMTTLSANNGSSVVTVASTSPDTWYHVEVTISVADNTYVVSVLPYGGSTTTSATYAFNNASTGMLQSLVLADNDQTAINGTVYLDNITLTAIPEPKSIASIASVGLLAWVFTRSRKSRI